MKHWILVGSLWLVALLALPAHTFARPPLFDLDPLSNQTVQATTHFETQVTYRVTDPACWLDTIFFSLDSAPGGMTITTEGKIRWTPTGAEAGSTRRVTVRATAPTPSGPPCYGHPGQDSESFTVTVTAPPVVTRFTASGSVRTHNLTPPEEPIPVMVSLVTNCDNDQRVVADYQGRTDAHGNYSIYWDPPEPGDVACYDREYGFTNYFYSVYIQPFGDETRATPERVFTFDASSNYKGDDIRQDFINAPELVSANGHWWARRIGPLTGFPVIDVEGFDPTNGFSSDLRAALMGCSSLDDRQCDVSCLTVPGESMSDCDFSGSPANVRDYLIANGYTVWLVLSGPNGGKSIKGSAGTQYTDGGAYQAMNITKKILDLTAAKAGKVRAALHGYSMGPVVIRAGLRHWCDLGTWESATLGDLRLPRSDCYNIGVWFSGDAPLEGAIAPLAAMRYIKDLSVNPDVRAAVDSPVAREMLIQWVTDGCNTDCEDLGGCSSGDSKFRKGCHVDNSAHDDFQIWAKGNGYAYPLYADGSKIPGIAYSLGMAPGVRPGSPYQEFIKNNVNNSKDHHLKFNTAGDGCNYCDNTEWVNGSLNNSAYKEIHGQSDRGGILGGLIGGYKVSMFIIPPYISTASALDWNSDLSQWWDYGYNDVNGFHAGPPHKAANQMVLAWIHEHLKGERSTNPICTKFRTVGMKAACRPPEAEVCDGKDNDGDELIDEGVFCEAAAIRAER